MLNHRALEIKAAKLKDVQELAVKYVPLEHMWFYRQFEDNVHNNNPDLSDNEY
jgi:alpha-galactosidase/6-phospho-beta-glucosidase family protein